jgi:hypothetical protein
VAFHNHKNELKRTERTVVRNPVARASDSDQIVVQVAYDPTMLLTRS